ncbi:Uncharacterised protein [Enterobacter hormaechei]|nr:Uncharacterised protein [Enterobacter hormaechei]
MDRVEADERAAALAHGCQHLFQVAKIANAPVAVRTQGIELHAGAPQLFAFKQRLRLIATLWRHDHPTVKTLVVPGKRKRVVALRQLRRKVKGFAACGMAFVLMPLFGGEQPAELAAPFHRQRHLFARGKDLHVRHRRTRRFRVGFVHGIQQTSFGVRTNRLRFAVRIDVTEANSRRLRGTVQTFTLHRASLAFCLPDTSLIITD